MKKLNKDIYDLLSEPKMFNTVIDLFNSFEDFKNELFRAFWEELFLKIKHSITDPSWVIKCSDEPSLNDHNSITINHKTDKGMLFSYLIYHSPSEFVYGIDFDREKIVSLEILYNESQKFKADSWRLGNLKNMTMPVWFSLKQDLNFKERETFRKLLPSVREITTEDIVQQVVEDFTPEIKSFIIRQLKKNTL